MQSNTVNRRGMLRKISGISFTSSALLTRTAFGKQDIKEIVTIRNGETPVKTKDVPLDWWMHIEKARDAREILQDKLGDNRAVAGIGITTGETEIEGRKSRRLTVRVHKGRHENVRHPTAINGIKIVRKTHKEPTPTNCHPSDTCDERDEDPVPGGAHLDIGTSTCKIYLDDATYAGNYLMTNAHGFVGSCGKENTKTVFQGKSDQKVGDNIPDYTDYHMDFSLINKASDSEVTGFTDKVKWTHDSYKTVSGHLTKDGVQDLVGTEKIYKYGRRTCLESGVIDEIYSSQRCDSRPAVDFIDASICTGKGDSGAPYFSLWKDDNGCEWAAIAGVNRGHWDNIQSTGCTAYEIANAHPITFGPDWSGPCGSIE